MTAEPTRTLPVIRPLGDTALSVDFGNVLSRDVTRRVLALEAAVTRQGIAGVIETVPTYRALTVHLDPLAQDLAHIDAQILALVDEVGALAVAGRLWQVPVRYGGNAGVDLEEVADRAGMTPAALIEAHAAPVYDVAMIGFLPGFCYLAGMDPRLSTPRRPQPRAQIPASSISIGGGQTAIGSVAGPSGWHLIGRTPVRPFRPDRLPVFLFHPGDRIRFHQVSDAEAERLQRSPEGGARVVEGDDA